MSTPAALAGGEAAAIRSVTVHQIKNMAPSPAVLSNHTATNDRALSRLKLLFDEVSVPGNTLL